MNDIIDVIRNKDNFVITAHHHPDGDAIGSTLGLYLALKKIGKNVDVIVDEAPKTFNYLVGFDEIKKDSDKEYDVGFILYKSLLQKSRNEYSNIIIINFIKLRYWKWIFN